MKKDKEYISLANKNKAIAGKELDKFIKVQLEHLVSENVIKSFKKNVTFNHQDYAYKKQFLANFLIETIDDKIIIVRSSTSFRSDRAKIGFYDIYGILKQSSFAKRVIASIYLVPNSELKNSSFLII